jgi:hypothetical protein
MPELKRTRARVKDLERTVKRLELENAVLRDGLRLMLARHRRSKRLRLVPEPDDNRD